MKRAANHTDSELLLIMFPVDCRVSLTGRVISIFFRKFLVNQSLVGFPFAHAEGEDGSFWVRDPLMASLCFTTRGIATGGDRDIFRNVVICTIMIIILNVS